ncbi:tRNA uridine(34) 5-carboxymethylaminomethyl modification radical SAM/GNAT enzyme Elp3 [Methanolobus halotolerans]|uniref:tRNA carboxymethyluridine synthase n=1 Tax=Methanolobus halotolerans TaxID=2052935 RepID=A0A4E0Q1K4_9EURY|nr:tRNA uridine(34) 5-carboxymethylaminomethyl modification radical SAM/GNAT enzyme Elp3 [Methanolobus halotolerans]TGC10975.1 tRNA uridine(34) 5-carboxymethylaminomethyl modification radical SAM/GNAT enzyme Elp3 [Methanolobus halotolerans]
MTANENPDPDFYKACREILEMVMEKKITDTRQLNEVKKKQAKKYRLSCLPKNTDIIIAGNEEEQEMVRDILRRKPVRTISGVAVIAAMTSPAPCPHGVCIPCPGGPDSDFCSPQSYMGREPSTMRAIQCEYDPYRIVAGRLKQLRQIGHEVKKAELIVMGGTFSARPIDYQEWYTKRCLEAMNDFYGTQWRQEVRAIGKEIPYVTLEDVQQMNEAAEVRNTGITFETRPDWASADHVDRMLELGATKVEIGVQSTYDFVLSRMKRGHTVADSIEANRILRDSGLKVGFHMMPGLPGMDEKREIRNFKRVFTDPGFKPDYLKIYPTLVTEGTELNNMWTRGEYQAINDADAVRLLANIKSFIPEWVRMQRIQRDIPAQQILAGVRKSNIRQLAQDHLLQQGGRCRCIRCREVGHNILQGKEPDVGNIELTVQSYDCCGGKEHFISFEDTVQDILIGFMRMRFPHMPHRKELENAALGRELHVYGSMVPVGDKAKGHDWQHRGYGAELVARAEEIARDAGYTGMAIMSGIGVRGYYRRIGYERDGMYMSKNL